MISPSEWARLTGTSKPRAPDGVAGLSLGSVAGVFTDPALSTLDLKVHRLTDEIGMAPPPTTEASASVLLSSDSLLIRWSQFFELHKNDIFADPAVRAEFDQFTREYNNLLQSWHDLGHASPETPMGEIPINPDNAPGAVSTLTDLLSSLKWIALAGLAAYVLVGTGAVAAVGALVAGSSARKKD